MATEVVVFGATRPSEEPELLTRPTEEFSIVEHSDWFNLLASEEPQAFIVIPASIQRITRFTRVHLNGTRDKFFFVPWMSDLSVLKDWYDLKTTDITLMPTVRPEGMVSNTRNLGISLLYMVMYKSGTEWDLRGAPMREAMAQLTSLVQTTGRPARATRILTPPTEVGLELVQLKTLGCGSFGKLLRGIDERALDCVPCAVATQFLKGLNEQSYIEFLASTGQFFYGEGLSLRNPKLERFLQC